MANIIILNVQVPFTRGGQDVLVDTLKKEVKNRGHNVDVISLPITSDGSHDNLLNHAKQWQDLKLFNIHGKKIDLVIATKFPSYYAKAYKKSVWLVHQHRPMYELIGGRYSDFSDGLLVDGVRRYIHKSDTESLRAADYVGAISKNVSVRLNKYNGVNSDTLYPPLPQGDNYYCNESDNYILSVGRICGIKRLHMLIEALPAINHNLKIKVAGNHDEPTYFDMINNLISKHALQNRVELLGRVSDQELLDLYANCYAVYYAPFDEDYGYVTLEAGASGKPVIAATDSGGVLEFIQDNYNGIVCQPNSQDLAKRVNKLFSKKDKAVKLGKVGKTEIDSLNLVEQGWNEVVEKLLSPLKNKE